MIFQVTYPSNEYVVKGYIAFPASFSMNVDELQRLLEQFYQQTLPPVVPIASSIKCSTHLLHKKLPVFIYCRGGIGRVGRVKLDWLEQFAGHGYLVFAPCYRGNEGGNGRDEFGGAENEDVLSIYRFLSSLPFVNQEQISIMGFSRGAINAVQTAILLPELHSLTLWGGVSDLAQTYEERMDLRRMLKRVIGGTPHKVPNEYESRSPVKLASSISCPVLIMHGTDDVQVHVSHGLQMYEALQKLGHPVDLHLLEGYGHHLPPAVHKQALEDMFHWIRTI